MTPKAPTAAESGAGDLAAEKTVDVAFERSPESYRVRIRMTGANAGIRELADPNAHCSSLAQAAALTIALLLDPDATLPAPAISEAPVEPEPAKTDDSRWSVGAEAGGGLAAGILRPAAPFGYLQASVSPRPSFALGIAGLIVPTQSLPLERGTIDVGLLAAQLRACAYPFARAIRIGGCAGIVGGVVSAAGRGYPLEGQADRLLLGATFEIVGAGRIVGRLGWAARLGGFAPFPRQTFGIEGAGVAYEAPPVGGLVSLGATFTFR